MVIRTEDSRRASLPLRDKLRRIYHGRTQTAVRFQYTVIAIDLATIAFFIAEPLLEDEPSFLWLNYSVATLLCLDLGARALASTHMVRWLMQPRIWLDVFILVHLLTPAAVADCGFL